MDQSNNQPSKSYFSLLNENLSHQYKSSINSSSNITSNLLLEEAWQSNSQTLNNTIDGIVDSAKQLVKNSNPLNVTSWTSSLSNIPDPISVFERSLQSCKCSQATITTYSNTDFMNDCICENNSPNVQTQTLELTSSQNSSHESKEENNKLFKPKFRNSKPSKTTLNKFIPLSSKKSSTSKEYDIEMDESKAYKGHSKNRYSALNREYEIEVDEPKAYKGNSRYKYCAVNKEYDIEVDNPKSAKTSRDVDMDDEEKAHKSHVAKITFKTAKEQLLASNPAARRTLGTSKKAQAKFVSPMLGALEKQESAEPVIIDERLKHIDPKMIELIESEIIDKGTPIGWDDIAGLQMAKSVIQEAVVWPLLRPDIFTGLRRPPRGILLFGPPGTGKTLIGKCVAAQCRATFFSISASSLTSKWIGDGEKMVRALFAVARCHQPAVIFIDEIDSLLTQRNDTEHEATRRIKTEFLVQFDGAATGEEDRLLIVGATNRPQELDEAARRRLVKRLYIPLPDTEARKQIISNLLKDENHDLAAQSVTEIAGLTDGYSGADMKSLCSEAAMGPIRSVPLSQIATIDRNQVRPVNVQDFKAALQRVRPSVSQDDLGQYVKWNNTYGQGF